MTPETSLHPPLELTVYPSTGHNHRPGWIVVLCPGCTADSATKAKRFTDAELAAELFRTVAWLGAKGRTFTTGEGRNIVIEAAFTFGPITRDEYEFQVIQRFANLPDHDAQGRK